MWKRWGVRTQTYSLGALRGLLNVEGYDVERIQRVEYDWDTELDIKPPKPSRGRSTGSRLFDGGAKGNECSVDINKQHRASATGVPGPVRASARYARCNSAWARRRRYRSCGAASGYRQQHRPSKILR